MLVHLVRLAAAAFGGNDAARHPPVMDGFAGPLGPETGPCRGCVEAQVDKRQSINFFSLS